MFEILFLEFRVEFVFLWFGICFLLCKFSGSTVYWVSKSQFLFETCVCIYNLLINTRDFMFAGLKSLFSVDILFILGTELSFFLWRVECYENIVGFFFLVSVFIFWLMRGDLFLVPLVLIIFYVFRNCWLVPIVIVLLSMLFLPSFS